jgi:uncharacterized membrane protein affecting hemolysin expression
VSVNAYNNDVKSELLFKSNYAMIISIIFLMLSAIPFGVNYFKYKNDIIKIEQVESIKDELKEISKALNK